MNKKIITDKTERLAKIVYEAMVRYTNSENTEIGEKTPHYRLDLSRIWRGNNVSNIDPMEK